MRLQKNQRKNNNTHAFPFIQTFYHIYKKETETERESEWRRKLKHKSNKEWIKIKTENECGFVCEMENTIQIKINK